MFIFGAHTYVGNSEMAGTDGRTKKTPLSFSGVLVGHLVNRVPPGSIV